MSKETLTYLNTSNIKKNFPSSGTLLYRKTTNVTTSTTDNLNGTAPNTQTHATGVKQITVLPLSYPILFCWDAPSGIVAKTWLDTTTTDSDVLNYVYVPAGQSYTVTFSAPVTRWDYVAVGTATAVYQEVAL